MLYGLPTGNAIPSRKPASPPFNSPDDPPPSYRTYSPCVFKLHILRKCLHIPPCTASTLTNKTTLLPAELGHITSDSECPPPGHYSSSPSFRFGLNAPPRNWAAQLRSPRSQSLHLPDRVPPSGSFQCRQVSLPLPNRLHCHKHLFLRTRKAGKGEEWKNSGMKDPVTQPTRQALTMHHARPQQHGGRPDGLRPPTAPSLPPPARPSSLPQ